MPTSEDHDDAREPLLRPLGRRGQRHRDAQPRVLAARRCSHGSNPVRARAGSAGRSHAHALRSRGDVLRAHSGRPLFRTPVGEETLAAGDVVFCPEGRAGAHTFSNPTDEPVRLLALSAGSFPDVVAYPEHGYAWVATRDPDPELLAKGGDPGIITRFEIPIE